MAGLQNKFTIVVDIKNKINDFVGLDYSNMRSDIGYVLYTKGEIKWGAERKYYENIEIINSFKANGKNEETGEQTITIKFPKKFTLTKPIKNGIDEILDNYIQTIFEISKDEMYPNSFKKLSVLAKPSVKKCTEMVYKYKFELPSVDESVNTLVDYIKNNDIKNSNTTLSKILKEKINTRLNNFIK